jgi:hypothetical protein
MPSEFKRRGDVSIKALAGESGFAEHKFDIDAKAIQQFLEIHPGLVGEWAEYSEDKRVSSGWYFDSAGLRVGFYERGKPERGQIYKSAAEACAVFIILELPWILYYDHVA